MAVVILHLALASDWAAAQAAGTYEVSTRGLTLQQQGYVHGSTPAQLPGVAGRFYADVTEALVVLELDEAALAAAGSPVRWEPVPDAPDPFPHVYGPVPVGCVLSVTPYEVPTGG